MKKYLCIALLSFLPFLAKAQQHALYSQYIFNLFAVNPAYAGERQAVSAALSYRTQWVGFEGAPVTGNFSLHSPIRNRNIAAGIWVQNDVIGARENTSFSGTFSYKIRLSEKRRISFGLSGGVINYQYHWNELEFPDGADPVSLGNDPNTWIPNFDFGVMYLDHDMYFGASLLSLNAARTNQNNFSDARLDPAIHLIGGKVFEISDRFALKPSFLLRKSMDGPYQFDLNFGARYANSFWLTTSYRHEFGMVFSAHYFINKQFHLGYAYDLPTNSLLSEQSGTHEIFVGFDFLQGGSSIQSPRNF